MLKTLPKYFPLLDHLYIYQILEYNIEDFFRWFLKNPFKRFLQKKHKLVISNKIIALLVFTIFWQLVTAFIFYSLTQSLIVFLIAFILIQPLTPIFIIMADLSLDPYEVYLKNKVLKKAEEKLKKLSNLKVVAITGSFGKTSTKDILYTLLWKKYYVVKTPKSFNTPLGIAQTILEDLKDNSDIFICEVGAYKIGEIKNICNLIKPKIGIITAIAPQHLEKFGSIENIAQAKFELPQSLGGDGVAILNSNFEQIKNLSSTLNSKIIFYGEASSSAYGTEGDKYYGTDIKTGIEGTSFTLHTPKGKTEIQIPLIGKHHVQNFLAATAAALQLGLTLSEIKDRAKLLLPTPHRMDIKKVGNMTIIDNSFNTNPKSAESSLNLLESFKNARKIVITPGFVELGEKGAEENEKFGEEIACVADEVIIVGENAKKDLLSGIKKVWPDEPNNTTHLVSSTQEALILAQQLANDTKVVVLLENDLPDQYN